MVGVGAFPEEGVVVPRNLTLFTWTLFEISATVGANHHDDEFARAKGFHKCLGTHTPHARIPIMIRDQFSLSNILLDISSRPLLRRIFY